MAPIRQPLQEQAAATAAAAAAAAAMSPRLLPGAQPSRVDKGEELKYLHTENSAVSVICIKTHRSVRARLFDKPSQPLI